MVFLRVRMTMGGIIGVAGDDAFEHWLVRHCDQRIDCTRVQFLAGQQFFVHFQQHIARAGDIVLRSLDHHPVPARADIDAQPVLDLHQIGIELPEQRAQLGLSVKHHLDPGAARGVTIVFGVGEVRAVKLGAGRLAGHQFLSG